jgi:hypothetical protein
MTSVVISCVVLRFPVVVLCCDGLWSCVVIVHGELSIACERDESSLESMKAILREARSGVLSCLVCSLLVSCLVRF